MQLVAIEPKWSRRRRLRQTKTASVEICKRKLKTWTRYGAEREKQINCEDWNPDVWHTVGDKLTGSRNWIAFEYIIIKWSAHPVGWANRWNSLRQRIWWISIERFIVTYTTQRPVRRRWRRRQHEVDWVNEKCRFMLVAGCKVLRLPHMNRSRLRYAQSKVHISTRYTSCHANLRCDLCVYCYHGPLPVPVKWINDCQKPNADWKHLRWHGNESNE